MTMRKQWDISWSLIGIVAAVLGCLSIAPTLAAAQCASTKGYNAVYGTCNSTTGIVGSQAFIDASVFTGDVCAKINAAYAALPSAGGVIDARGISTPSTCASSPWSTFSSNPPPATILLPRGTITIPSTWVMPDRTRIVGAGKTQTSIQAASTFTVNSQMIWLGNSTYCGTSGCTGISVSDLQLTSPDGLAIDGIRNFNSQDLSYVSGVAFRFLEGTGLDVETSGANNSGPYTDLNVTIGGTVCTGCHPVAASTCVKLISVQTRGVHGMTCTSNGTPTAGIYLDGNNNTIEDVHFEGLVDGIQVGDQAAASGNVLMNLSGASSSTSSGTQQNIVHICGSNPPTGGTTACSGSHTVTDLSIFHIESFTIGQRALVDDITATLLKVTTGNGAVGMYAFGQPLNGGYSRFTTATATGSTPTPKPTPTWGVGSVSPSSSTCPTGTLFSNTSGSTLGTTLYVCTSGNAWSSVP